MSIMSGMGGPSDGLWSWCASVRLAPADVRSAVSGVLERPVTTLDVPVEGAVLCDVWHVGGNYPTLIDCYLTPGEISESTVASAVAVRLNADILLPDDTRNPSRYVRADPSGDLRPVHVDEVETDDGPERRHVRPCTGVDPACAAHPGCGGSQWPPTPVAA